MSKTSNKNREEISKFYDELDDDLTKKTINKFLSILNKDLKKKFKELFIKKKKLKPNTIQSIANYNYQKNYLEENENLKPMRFIVLCFAIESYNSFDDKKGKGYSSMFKDFFKALLTKERKNFLNYFTFRKKEKVKNYSPSKGISKIARYLYEKRSKMAHKGVHFSGSKYSCLFDYSESDDLRIETQVTIDILDHFFLLALYQNIKID